MEENVTINCIKRAKKHIGQTGSIQQLYICFKDYKSYLFDVELTNAFIERVRFFERRATSRFDKEQCQELLIDIESEIFVEADNTDIYSSIQYAPESEGNTISLSFKTSNGNVMRDGINTILKMSAERFSGQHARMAPFLGISVSKLKDLIADDKFLKRYVSGLKKEAKDGSI